MQQTIKPVNSPQVKNPCVRNCCLDEQDVCLGCGRTLEEITSWSRLTDEQRSDVLKLAERRKQERSLW